MSNTNGMIRQRVLEYNPTFKRRDPKGRSVLEWLPSMKTIKQRYTTRLEVLDLKGMDRESCRFATTHPLFVLPAVDRSSFFTAETFHAALYSHGTDIPFRPIVVRQRARLPADIGLTEAAVQREGAADQFYHWNNISVEAARRVPTVPFEVTARAALQLLLFRPEDVSHPAPLFERNADGAPPSEQPPEQVGAARRFQHHSDEGLLTPLPGSSFVLRLTVPESTRRLVDRLNRQLRGEQTPVVRNAALSFSAQPICEVDVRLHPGDVLYIPRGWPYVVRPVPFAGMTEAERDRVVAPKKEKWPREDWEYERDVAAETLIRTPLGAPCIENGDFARLPGLIRHVYAPFPQLSASEARLERGQNPFASRSSFYHPKPVDSSGSSPPPRPAMGGTMPSPRWRP